MRAWEYPDRSFKNTFFSPVERRSLKTLATVLNENFLFGLARPNGPWHRLGGI